MKGLVSIHIAVVWAKLAGVTWSTHFTSLHGELRARDDGCEDRDDGHDFVCFSEGTVYTRQSIAPDLRVCG